MTTLSFNTDAGHMSPAMKFLELPETMKSKSALLSETMERKD
jgi:hypothetical protein